MKKKNPKHTIGMTFLTRTATQLSFSIFSLTIIQIFSLLLYSSQAHKTVPSTECCSIQWLRNFSHFHLLLPEVWGTQWKLNGAQNGHSNAPSIIPSPLPGALGHGDNFESKIYQKILASSRIKNGYFCLSFFLFMEIRV